jgi:hypothetical protein
MGQAGMIGSCGPLKYGMFSGAGGRAVGDGARFLITSICWIYSLRRGVKAQVSSEVVLVISVSQKHIIPVLNIHVPGHKSHLEPKDGGIVPVIREDKIDGVPIGYPSELLPKAHMTTFINAPIARKSFAQVRVQTLLIAAG